MPQRSRQPSQFVERLFLAAIPLAPAGAAVGSVVDGAVTGSTTVYDFAVLAATGLLAVVAAALTSRLRDTVVYGVALAIGLVVAGIVFFEGVLRLL